MYDCASMSLSNLLGLPDSKKIVAFDALINFLLEQDKNSNEEPSPPPVQIEDNAGKPWDKIEENKLLFEIEKGMSVAIIAANHGRSSGGINSRLRQIAYRMYTEGTEIETIMKVTGLDRKNLEATIQRREKPSSLPPKPSKGKYEYVDALDQKDQSCFANLKTWRNQVARDMDWKPYMVFDNKTLMAMAHYRPQSEEEFLKIKGMGPEKLGRYYHSLQEIVNQKEVRRLIAPVEELKEDIDHDLPHDDSVPIQLPSRRFLKKNK